MRRAVSLLMIFLVLMFTVLCATAEQTDIVPSGITVVEHGDWIIKKVENDSAWELNDYIGTDTDIITPRFIDSLPVIAYGDHCFANDENVKCIVTSSPLWTIGDYAFIGCKSLEYFELNYALRRIGAGAFCGTTALKSINLQKTTVSEIQAYSFMNSGLEEVELPSTCSKLSDYSFAQCYQLNKITIPVSVVEIADTAFDKCENLTIYCYTDSTAHQYAISKGVPFVLLDVVTPTEPSTEPPTEPQKYLLGDADKDGVVTILDATVIQRVLAGFAVKAFDEKAANVSSDGLNIVDATLIQRYLAEMTIPYPVGEWIACDE